MFETYSSPFINQMIVFIFYFISFSVALYLIKMNLIPISPPIKVKQSPFSPFLRRTKCCVKSV